MTTADPTLTPEGHEADWIATLKFGATYTMGTNPETSKRYHRGVDYPISEETKLKLEERAVDQIDNGDADDDGNPVTEPRSKFTFRRVGEAAKAAPRRRVRASG